MSENTRLHKLIDLAEGDAITIQPKDREYCIGVWSGETAELIAVGWTLPEAIEAAIAKLTKVVGP